MTEASGLDQQGSGGGVGPSSGCGPTCCRSAGTRATGGYRRFAWTPRRPDLPRVVRRRGGAARARPRGRPQRQPVGLVGRPGRRRPGRRHRQPPRLGAGRRRVRRPARRRVARSPRVDLLREPRRRPGAAARRGELHRRGGRAVRHRLRRVAAAHRRARPGPGPRPDRRRRHHAGRGHGARPGATRRSSGRDDETLRRVGTFVELHVEQGRGAGRPRRAGRRREPASGRTAGGGSTSHGEANHAGTTRLVDRDDPMLRLAAAVLAAREAAAEHDGAVATIGRVAVAPERHQRGALARCRAWLDARGPDEADGPRRRRRRSARAAGAEPRRGVLDAARSRSPAGLRDRLGRPARRRTRCCRPAPGTTPASWPTRACRAAMLFVRNPTGVSHSPAEHAEPADCHAGVAALATRAGRPCARPGARGVTTYHARPRLAAARPAGRDVRLVVEDGRITDVARARRPRRRRPARRAGAAGPGERALARLPPGAARPDPGGDGGGARSGPGGSGCTPWPTRLDPDSYLALARATYAEMVLAGITCVGEFHYLHHGARRRPLRRPERDGARAGRGPPARPGCGITLLDTCYLARRHRAATRGGAAAVRRRRRRGLGGPGRDAALAYDDEPDVVVGAAVHSVRAVPADQLATIAAWAGQHGAPLHAHVSEQRRRTTRASPRTACTPTRLLHERGVLGERSSAVHATHLTDDDIALLGGSRDRGLHVPDDRARPGRRRRPRSAAARRPARR